MDSDLLRWILLGVFVLGCIFFIVLLVLGAKTWRVLHILSVLFVFASTATFAVFFAMTTKTTLAWREIAATNRAAAEKGAADVERLTYGEVGSEYSTESLVGAQSRLGRELVGRGRVWRNAAGQVQGNNLVVTLAQATAEDGTELPTATIEAGSPVFVFLEGELTSGLNPALNGIRVPQRYLGEFNTLAPQGNIITLEPILTFYRTDEFPGPIGVVVYEKMPGDRSDVLVQAERNAADPVQTRQLLVNEVFPPGFFNITPEILDPASPTFDQAIAARYERLIDEYQFDGMAVGDIAAAIATLSGAVGNPGIFPRIRSEFDMAPNETWIELELLKPYVLDVDAPNAGGDEDVRRTAVGRGFYDPKGLAISADLRLERDVELKPGDVVLVDKVTAEDGYKDSNGTPIESLVAQGIGRRVGIRYFRQLNDYGLMFRELNLAKYRLDNLIAKESEKLAILQASVARSEQHLTTNEELQEKLRFDVDSLTRDVETVTTHLAKLEALLAARRQKINELFVQTQGLARRKAELEEELVRRVDSATASATTVQ
ncbi:MAG TPA: hypothetical protein PLI18_10985 [Pirellulaceae bacterium]|nr:hypothetical protein [Pirellulaceae bacterium]